MRRCISILVPWFLVSATLAAEPWPHWRGPRFDGVSTAKALPTTWTAVEGEEEHLRWRLELPGPASSSPIVWGDRIYLTTTRKGDEALGVMAVSSRGEVIWSRWIDDGAISVFQQFAHETNAASPSPVTDGEHLWVLFGTARLFQLDLDGQVSWQVDLADRYGAPSLFFGLSASPLLLGDRLYLHLIHADAQLVLALDKATGEEIWRTERPTDAKGECLHSYASIVPFEGSEPSDALLLVHGADYLTAHDRGSGVEVWRYGTLNPPESYNSMFRLVATPTSRDGLVVVPTAKRGPVFGLRPGSGRDRLGEERVVWKLERGTPDVPSPLVDGGLVYLAGENGRLTVLDAETGETLYAERVHQSQHRASPVLADGKLFLTATDGTVSVLRPGREYELLAKNRVDGGRLSASPAVVDGTIYLRSYDALFALGEDAAERESSADSDD